MYFSKYFQINHVKSRVLVIKLLECPGMEDYLSVCRIALCSGINNTNPDQNSSYSESPSVLVEMCRKF